MVKHRGDEIRKLLGTTDEGELLCTHCGKLCNSMPAFTYHVVGCLPTDIRNCDEIVNGLGLGVRPHEEVQVVG
jgi:hypothetical protein